MEQGGLKLRGISKGRDKSGEPVISIITIVCNGEKFIEQSIKSVISQSYNSIEYIIIDGDSSDGTKEIIKKYDDFIDFWISEPDNGISDAFNKGVKYSTGDFIAFLNSDDWYEPDVIGRVVSEMKSSRLIYCGNMNIIDLENVSQVKLHKSRPDRIFQTMRIAHPASFVPKEVFNSTGGFSGEYLIAMDFDFMMRAKLAGHEFSVIDILVTNHRRGGVSSNAIEAIREELIIKNRNLGWRFTHYLWYYLNLAYFTVFSRQKMRIIGI